MSDKYWKISLILVFGSGLLFGHLIKEADAGMAVLLAGIIYSVASGVAGFWCGSKKGGLHQND